MEYRPELLSPAGSVESLVAAVQNGADAVYLGGKRFNAREYASNFDDQALKHAVEYAHIRGVKVYVTLNTLLDDNELEEAIEYVGFLYTIGADAVIVQDVGLACLIKDIFPDMEVHASTQMTIYNLEGTRFLERLGISRVVLARELSLDEVKYINHNTNLELEVFIQGALCMCYSGQCLMSSLIGGRSGNRGRCAQPCRLRYALVDRENGSTVLKEGYLLSPRDLFTLDRLDELLDSRIASFKIEGRMKRPEYVAAVTSCYRKGIDRYLKHGSTGDGEGCREVICRVFNRGFTGGYLLSDGPENFLSGDRPGNRGVPLGEVVHYDKKRGRAVLQLEAPLSQGDGIEVESQGKSLGTTVTFIEIGGKPADTGRKGQTVAIGLSKPVKPGDRVFKTFDRKLMEDLAASYRQEHKKIPVVCSARFKLGELPRLYVWDDKGNMVMVEGGHTVEKARKNPLAEERIKEHLCKTGGTPYAVERVEIDADKGVFLPVSEINRLRRAALQELDSKRVKARQPVNISVIKSRFKELVQDNPGSNLLPRPRIWLSVETGEIEAVSSFVQAGADRVFLRYHEKLEGEIEKVGEGLHLFIKLPLVSRMDSIQSIIELLRDVSPFIEGVEISNPGQLEALRGLDVDLKIHGGDTLNIFNRVSLKTFTESGCSAVTLSPELNISQVKRIAGSGYGKVEVIVHGILRVMTVEYPLLEGLPEGRYGLKDKKGMVFPVFRDGAGKIEICNSRPLFMLDRMRDVAGTGVNGVRLLHRDENIGEFCKIVKNYKKAITCGEYDGNMAEQFLEKGFTRGHFYRGV